MSSLPAWWRLNPYAEPQQPLFSPYTTGPLELLTPPVGRCLSLAEAKAHCRIDSDFNLDDAHVLGLIDAAADFCEQEIDGQRQLLSAVYVMPVQYWWSGILKLRPPLQSVNSISYFDTGGTIQTLAASVYMVRNPVKQPGYIERAPNQNWPAVQGDRRYPVLVTFTAGYGPGTTIAASIATGSQTVTPASMLGIFAPTTQPTGTYPGTRLVIDTGDNQETVAVTAATSTTFTATFAKAHTATTTVPIPVTPGIPPVVRQAMLMLVAHWYRNREAAAASAGLPKAMDLAVKNLLALAGWGSYK